MSEWISVKDQEPPKDEPFLVFTTYGIEMMEWGEHIVDGINQGWYGLHSACYCCSGFCSVDFNYWMSLPEPPKEHV